MTTGPEADPAPSRRAVLRGIGAGLAWLGAGVAAGAAPRAKGLPVAPDRATPARRHEVTLTAAERRIALPGAPGGTAPLWSYAETAFPTLRIARGDRVEATLVNRLSEHTSIHWHGLRIANAMDGVQYLTQPPVQPGASHLYDFVAPDPGTFFFHPHCNESGQVGRGMAGILIVEGDERVRSAAELVLAVKDWRIGEDGRWLDFTTPEGASRAGTFGTIRSANGVARFAADVPAGRDVRLRLLNLDSTRVMEVGVEGAEAWIIAVDGHAVPPVALDTRGTETWRMGPAMRLDLLLRVEKAGGVARLLDYFAAEPWPIATLTATGPAPVKRRPFDPAVLWRPVFPEPDLKSAERLPFAFTAASDSIAAFRAGFAPGDPLAAVLLDSLCVSDRTYWAMNKLSWPNAANPSLPPPIATLAAGRTYVFELLNATPHPHPIHLHGHVFRVLSSSKGPIPPYAADTVLLSPKERVEIAFVAAPGDWMFHCHILEHLETGMMGYVRVA